MDEASASRSVIGLRRRRTDRSPEDLLLDGTLSDEQRHLLSDRNISAHTKNGLMRGKMVDQMITEVVEVFKEHYETIMEGRFERSLFDKAHGNSMCFAIADLYKRESLCQTIYQNQRNVPLELGVYSVFRTLLEASVEAAHELASGSKLSYKTQIIQRFVKYTSNEKAPEKGLYQVLMPFLDYITGMTDDYATFMNRQLLGLGN